MRKERVGRGCVGCEGQQIRRRNRKRGKGGREAEGGNQNVSSYVSLYVSLYVALITGRRRVRARNAT